MEVAESVSGGVEGGVLDGAVPEGGFVEVLRAEGWCGCSLARDGEGDEALVGDDVVGVAEDEPDDDGVE